MAVACVAPCAVRISAVTNRALRDAVRWGRLVRNPADMADPPARARTRAEAWTAEELRRFLQHVEGDRLYPLWRLAATTGMRRGELAGLTWRSLDLDGARLRLTESFSRHRKAAGIPTGSLHVLRHTAATLALTSGVPVHIVAARLGDTPQTVLSTYAHLLPRSDELAAERIATLIE